MEITFVLYGTVTIDPGTGQGRVLDLPPGVSYDELNTVFSAVCVTDPTNTSLFKLHGWGQPSAPTSGSRDAFLGVRQIQFGYDLTGSSPISVDFQAVFTDSLPVGGESYSGG